MPSFHLCPTLLEERDFRFATDQRREASGLSHLKATGGPTLTKHVVEAHGLGNAPQGVCSQVLTREIALHQAIRRVTDGHRIGRSQPLDSGSDIWRLPQS